MLYEDGDKLSKNALDLRRAIDSLKEELEAIDLYNQRAEMCTDKNLKKILLHNRDEEKEHAIMLIEWIRQNDKEFAKEASEYLNLGTKDITSAEDK
ncbi:MAG: ferritin [Nanoarchaeota archaeon]|nr:ferritin [Nanoarchaeota archaeon]